MIGGLVNLDKKQFEELKEEVVTIKRLIVLALQKSDIKGDLIAKALGVSQGRLSQLMAIKKYKKRK